MTTEAQRPSQSANAMRQRIAEFVAEYGIFFVLILMVVVIAILTPIIRGEQYFLTPRNLIQVGLQASINAIIAVGMTFVITSGGIDLSVGSIVALCGVLAALVMRDAPWEQISATLAPIGLGNFPFRPITGLVVCLVVGAACGFTNGFMITRFNLPPFIVTLGTLGIFRGLALIISEGQSIFGFGRDFLQTFSANIPVLGVDVPIAVIISFAVAAAGWFIYRRLRFGKYTIAIGSNEETTRLAGIPVNRYKLGIYTFAGLLTGLAAALLLARLSSGDPTFGQLFELDAIAASVMGGTSLTGGEGSIGGTLVGALIISLVKNAMNIFNLPSYWQQLVIGLVIVLAVLLDRWRKDQASRT